MVLPTGSFRSWTFPVKTCKIPEKDEMRASLVAIATRCIDDSYNFDFASINFLGWLN